MSIEVVRAKRVGRELMIKYFGDTWHNVNEMPSWFHVIQFFKSWGFLYAIIRIGEK